MTTRHGLRFGEVHRRASVTPEFGNSITIAFRRMPTSLSSKTEVEATLDELEKLLDRMETR